ncbi:MAG: hypothetical protein OEY19_05445 [Gammaproteobacteria bacterium]|nr:hypothetical protein [Gammaproteobacteria bacterium]MDH5629152.1 hypothetical protein [Gammaproteobacteria bacterium]
MQKFLKIFGIIVLLLIIVGLVLDNSFEARREIVIKTDRQTALHYLQQQSNWQKWFPWMAMDPSVEVVSDNESDKISWKGVTGGGQIINLKFKDDQIMFHFQLTGDESIFTNQIDIVSKGSDTKLIWQMNGEMSPIVVGNYFAQIMDGIMGQTMDSGLQQIKNNLQD